MADLASYDFSKHDAAHYDKYEYSYGLIIINPAHTKVFLIQTPTNFYGFPKGHRNDEETPQDAAAREIKEELGFRVDPNDYLGYVSLKYDAEYTQETLNTHIAKKSEIGERPYWNRVGPVTRKIVFFIVEMDEAEVMENLHLKANEVKSAKWHTFKDAGWYMRKSNSNHDYALRAAIASLKRGVKRLSITNKVEHGTSSSGFEKLVAMMIIVIALMFIVSIWGTPQKI